MILRTTITAAALALAAGIAPVSAEEIGPSAGRSIDVGFMSGVAYYVPAPEGYRVVVTLAQREAAPTVRFESVLASGQSVTLSAPREPGAAAETIGIRREGGTVTVTTNRGRTVLREAAARE